MPYEWGDFYAKNILHILFTLMLKAYCQIEKFPLFIILNSGAFF